MDGSRFDSLTRRLASGQSRRTAAALIGSLLATPLLVQPSVARKKKKKVTLCHQGQTISVSKKKKKTHLKHGDTLGACPNPPPPPPPGTTTTTPAPFGPCAGKADNAECNGDGRCLNGVCNPKPTCHATNAVCTTDAQCCTKACEGGECDGGSDAQPNGAECQVDLDCRSRRCVGYRCLQGAAPAGSFCDFDARCASNRCSCAGPSNTECTCRETTCGEIPATCDQDDPLGRDVDCCDGSCCQSACVPEDCFGKCAQTCSNVNGACCSRLTCRQVTTNTRLCLP